MTSTRRAVTYICRNPECKRECQLDLDVHGRQKRVLFGARPLEKKMAKGPEVYVVTCPFCSTENRVKV